MSRPSRNQDKILIETTKKLLLKSGAGAMSLKKIADESGVNLGMIHYYFRTKSVLMRCVLESINEELVKEFETSTLVGKTPLKRLRNGLITIAMNIYVRRKIVASLVAGALGHDEETRRFFLELTGKRFQLITPLIQQCQKEGSIEPLPFYQVLSFCMASINFPTLIAEGIDRLPVKELNLPGFVLEQLTSEKAIIQRVDLALKAISCKKRSRP
jgi:AcrR family transcriptional regulator